jgi:hypothetical protein
MTSVEATAPVSLAPPAAEPCVNCGEPIVASFCGRCGERRASERDNSLVGFGAEVVQTFASLDRSLLGSLRSLLARPGELTVEFMRGRRVNMMRPLQLFLLVNVGFFIWSTASDNRMFDTPLNVHMHDTWHKSLATRLVQARIESRHITMDAYRRTFDDAATVQAKTLIVTMVPVFALLVGLLHLDRRRYLLEHLVFALHTYAALLILVVITAYALALPSIVAAKVFGQPIAIGGKVYDNLFGLTLALTLGWYLRRAVAVVYEDGRTRSVVSAVVLFLGVGFILFGYRTLLFLTTFWAT